VTALRFEENLIKANPCNSLGTWPRRDLIGQEKADCFELCTRQPAPTASSFQAVFAQFHGLVRRLILDTSSLENEAKSLNQELDQPLLTNKRPVNTSLIPYQKQARHQFHNFRVDDGSR
jgi:hypothetical protein